MSRNKRNWDALVNNEGQYYKDGIGGGGGTPGAKGDKGEKGGGAGQKGQKGEAGSDGAKGDAGTNGTNGTNGAKGSKGSAGTNGTNGTNGTKGEKGSAGTAGTNGAKGAKGTEGVGTKGIKGSDGPKGSAGFGITIIGNVPNGTDPNTDPSTYPCSTEGNALIDAGDGTLWICDGNGTWIEAPPLQGAKGDEGDKGQKGQKGQKGLGDKGDQGAKGVDGTMPAAAVSAHVNFNGQTPNGAVPSGDINAQHEITSVEKIGTGHWRITFAITFLGAEAYTCVGTAGNPGTGPCRGVGREST